MPHLGQEEDNLIFIDNWRRKPRSPNRFAPFAQIRKHCTRFRVAFTFMFALSAITLIIILILQKSKNSLSSDSTNVTYCTTGNGSNFDTDCPWSKIRLPVYYRPEHYLLYLTPNFTGYFDGNVSIQIYIDDKQENLLNNWLILHSKDLTVISIEVEQPGVQAKRISPNNWRFCPKNEQLALLLPELTGNFSLNLQFRGNLSDELDGLYKSFYIAEDGKTKKNVATTQFEPTSARKMFPCFDEPSFKAYFSLIVIHEPEFIALSNAPLVDSTPISLDGIALIKDTFDQTVKMSTYLLAVIICDYKNVTSKTSSGVTVAGHRVIFFMQVSVFAPPHQIDQTSLALNISIRTLEFFEQFFGVHYPLKKLDLISINDFQAGAMENWGLITFRDIYLLHEPQKASASSEELVVEVIVHEISHQWFGNLVTMKWWNDLWLNEGFADFMEHFGTDAVQPTWNMMSKFVSDSMESALSLDGLVNTHPVSSDITDPSEIESMFDDISYSKGASLIRYLMSIIGLADLKIGLQDYLTSNKYSNAEEKDLWTFLNKHTKNFPAKLTVADFMKNYVKLKGYPLVEVSIKNGRLYANQTRFYYLIDELMKLDRNASWNIPLTVRTDSTKKPVTFWIQDQQEINVDTNLTNMTWFKANVDSTGFYRVNYAEDNWVALFKALGASPETLTAADRTGLINDAFTLLTVGKMKVDLLFDFLHQLLIKERSRGVWDIVYRNLRHIESRLRESEAYRGYCRYVASVVELSYSTLGWSADVGNHELAFVSKYVSKLACLVNVGDCRKRAVDFFKNFTEQGQELNPNFRYLSCMYAVADESDSMFDKVFTLYNSSKVPAEKSDYLLCLANTRSYWLLWRFLEMTLDPTIVKTSLIPTVFDSVINEQPIGSILVWHFFRKNYDKIKKAANSTTNNNGRSKASWSMFSSMSVSSNSSHLCLKPTASRVNLYNHQA